MSSIQYGDEIPILPRLADLERRTSKSGANVSRMNLPVHTQDPDEL